MKGMFVSHHTENRHRRSVCFFLAVILPVITVMITGMPDKGFCEPQDITSAFIHSPGDGGPYYEFIDQSTPAVYWYDGT